MTREEKLEAIYKEIANKKVSFGCRYMHNGYRYTVDDSNYRLRKEWDNYYLYITTFCNCPREIAEQYNDFSNQWAVEIIGHPVMIGDVIDWIENKEFNVNVPIMWFWFDDGDYSDETKLFLIQKHCSEKACSLWEHKRKSIEDQSDECIDYVYSLIPSISME